ncbi:LysR family transcriptional regulator [Vibrio lentus]|uniref:LysR family transcriptional regulator n=1 Tax=Vibrio lentus TaxID=136468 RepID=A0A2N7JVP9_9VIBR|nr:LysR family transcriptional regulator [Vibrio lentus]PMM63743.1 LysR family transcriptional regulator [Vibrio lentus]
MSQLDLNLLKVLRVLIEVKNTRKASELLHISQPAVSRALSRLRDYFEDELFVRTAHGLAPTSKALEIGARLPTALDNLMFAIEGDDEFDPAQINEKVSIAINGFLAQWLAPKLIKSIVNAAPNIELHITNWEANTPSQITQGNIDIGVNYFPLNLSKQLVQQKMGTDSFVVVTRKNHPLAAKDITAEHFITYPIASQLIPSWNEVSNLTTEALRPFAIVPKVQLRSSHLNIILDTMLVTDLLFPCSKSLAVHLPSEFKYFPINDEITIPGGDFATVVSNQARRHPLQQWLNETIKKCSSAELLSESF